MFWAVYNKLVNKPAEDWNSDETEGKELRVYEEEATTDKRLIFLEKLIELQENLKTEECKEAFDTLYTRKMRKVISEWQREEEDEAARKLQGNSLGQPEHEMKLQLDAEAEAMKSDDIDWWKGTKNASLNESIQQVKSTKPTKFYHKLNAWMKSRQMTHTKKRKKRRRKTRFSDIAQPRLAI